MATFFVCLGTVDLQEVRFGYQLDDLLSAACLESRCFLGMRVLRNTRSTVALCIRVRGDMRSEKWQDSLCVCMATLLFVKCCKKLDLVIEWTTYS